MQRRVKPLDEEGLWNYALKILGGRGYSIAQMRVRLKARAEDPALVPKVLARLKQYGYLNDRRLAEGFAASRRDNQAQGRFRVLRDLRRKQVAPAVAEQAVAEVYRDTDEYALAEEFLSRRLRRVHLPEYLADPKRLASAYRKLRLAGFSSAVAARLLKKHALEPELVDHLEEEDGLESQQ